MTIDEWKRLAKERLISGEMTEMEWHVVLDTLLQGSEGEGLCEFDESIDRMSTDPRWAK